MKALPRPLVFVHGLWDDPSVFKNLISKLGQSNKLVFTPHLPHDFGRCSIYALTLELDRQILLNFGSKCVIDLLGFSMGGLITRLWLQNFYGAKRTQRFFSVGSPQNGTLTAQLVPQWLLSGIADMKVGSRLIRELELQSEKLSEIDCRSFYSFFDLMVFPGYKAVLPYGQYFPIPVLTHKDLIINAKSIDILVEQILTFPC